MTTCLQMFYYNVTHLTPVNVKEKYDMFCSFRAVVCSVLFL